MIKLKHKGQTSTEYIVIIAVVIVIALTVVSLINDSGNISGGSSKKITDYELTTGEVSIEKYGVFDSYTLLKLKNNYLYKLTVSSIVFGGYDCSSNEFSFTLDIGEFKIINCTNINSTVVSSATTPSVSMNWTDLSNNADYTTNFGNVNTTSESIGNESGGSGSSNYFISLWNTSKTGTSNASQITLPIYDGGSYNFTVDWGDGNVTNITSYTQATHTYPAEGTYTVNITGEISGFRFNNGGDKSKIIDISMWGSLNLGNNAFYFFGCDNLNSSATDSLNLTGTTSLRYAFAEATNFNGNLSGWNVSEITEMTNTFYLSGFNRDISSWDTGSVVDMDSMFASTSFNQDIGSWDTSNVYDMSSMFSSNSEFNQDISGWDVSNVTDMSYMFLSATSFNQDIGSWDTRNLTTTSNMFYDADAFNQSLTSWDTSKVTTMTRTFYGAGVFNGNLSGWDTSNVTDLSHMFGFASNFNQDLNTWNTSNVTTLTNMFTFASAFNGDVSNWDTSNVDDLSFTFYSAGSFNQDISSWDISNVTNMDFMFFSANVFNQNLSAWDTRNITSYSGYDTSASAWLAGNKPTFP